jgi:PAS domain-containing protein
MIADRVDRQLEGGKAMTQEQHHVGLIKGISEQFKSILEKSGQAIYIYLDDTHKTCNKNFATLLGYKSVREWVNMETPLDDIDESSQPAVVSAYGNATEKLIASSLNIKVKNKTTGELIKARMIMVPIAYEGHVLALHFVSRI